MVLCLCRCGCAGWAALCCRGSWRSSGQEERGGLQPGHKLLEPRGGHEPLPQECRWVHRYTFSSLSPFFLLTSPLSHTNRIIIIKAFGVIGAVEIRGGNSVRGVMKLSSLSHVCSNKWKLEKGTWPKLPDCRTQPPIFTNFGPRICVLGPNNEIPLYLSLK